MTDGAKLGYPISENVYAALKDAYDHDSREIQFQTELAMRSWMAELPGIETESDDPDHGFDGFEEKKKTPPSEKTQVWVRVRPRTKEQFEKYVDLVGLDGYGEGLELALREHLTDPVYPDLAQPGEVEFDLAENRSDEEISEPGENREESPIEALPEAEFIADRRVEVRENFEEAVRARDNFGRRRREAAARLVGYFLDLGEFFISREDVRTAASKLDIGQSDGSLSNPPTREYTDVVIETLDLQIHPIYPNHLGMEPSYIEALREATPDALPSPAEATAWSEVYIPQGASAKVIEGYREATSPSEEPTLDDYAGSDESDEEPASADEEMNVLTESASYSNAAADD